MATPADGELLYKGFLNLRYGMALTFQEYYCVLSDTGVFTVYTNEDQATNNPTKFINQVRLGGTKDWDGKTMLSSHDNSIKFVTDKGKEISASGHNRNEVTLWAKSIKAVTDPESKEGQKLAKAKRKQQREREREQKRQEEYEIRAKAHRALPKATEIDAPPPISYLTDPRRTRLDARNFPKYRQHLQDAKLETRLTAPLDEAKQPEEPQKVKKKKKRPAAAAGSDDTQPRSADDNLFGAPPPPPSAAAQSAPPPMEAKSEDLTMKFQNLLQLGFSHEEVKAFMAAEGHTSQDLDAVSRNLQRMPPPPGSPTKRAKAELPPSTEKKPSFFDKIFRRGKT
ncbi:unnamed protein product [Aphanomyces euteiches]|uniref:PH domain-containing protein n=1 Tax=Aphanomyces euteiches TaxID=100861 RepID=A0A6G0W4K0_9STRA|nr:hypothetical protein Ae201684_018817 [Aphanomyces euteiches]KAH9061606.1 hypothetical protein Ae201684P_020941 [Aphanomyces euteiches]KAH9108446.1 hypothetical protein AeMF1_016393 [Aphanomyces euteiches]KAH9140965.1 hypothetical protein AeRB84_014824 [Aphanomyces euteiches]